MDARGAQSIGCLRCSIFWPYLRWRCRRRRSRDIAGQRRPPVRSAWPLRSGGFDSISRRRCAPIPRHGQKRLDTLVVDCPRLDPVGRTHHCDRQIVFLCQDSQPGPNQYGPNPKFPEQAAVIAGNPGFAPAGFPAPPTAAATSRGPVWSWVYAVVAAQRWNRLVVLHQLWRASLRSA